MHEGVCVRVCVCAEGVCVCVYECMRVYVYACVCETYCMQKHLWHVCTHHIMCISNYAKFSSCDIAPVLCPYPPTETHTKDIPTHRGCITPTYMHTRTYMHTYMHTPTHTHTHTHARAHTHIHTYAHTHMPHTCTHTYTHTCLAKA